MQLAVLEYSKNKLKLPDPSTAEIKPTAKNLVVDIMPEQKEKLATSDMGGTMRLGEYTAKLKKGTIAYSSYSGAGYKLTPDNHKLISERHRHRYEVNPEYIERLEREALLLRQITGRTADGDCRVAA